jgi:hypothetical protein
MLFENPNTRIAGYLQAVLTKSRVTTQSGGSESPVNSLVLKGVQSVGISRSLERESFADIGRFQKEYGRYAKHTYTINISRVLNKSGDFFYNTSEIDPPTYENSHIFSTEEDSTIGFTGINNRLKNYDIVLLYTPDGYSYVGAGALLDTPDTQVQTTVYRCCLLTNISYTIPINGPITEDLTFTTHAYTQETEYLITDFTNLNFVHDSEETLKRQDISINNCIFPTEVEKMFNLTNTYQNIPIYGLQQIEISTELAYTDLQDIGKWGGSYGDLAEMNLYKQLEIPVGVSCTFSGIVRGQYFNDENGKDHLVTDTYHTAGVYGAENKNNSTGTQYRADRQIRIAALTETNPNTYLQWNLGKKNYISSFEITGGDANGGNVEASISFQNDHSEIFLLKDTTLRDSEFSSTKIY